MLRFILLITVILFSGAAYAFDDGDFQYWNTESASWKLNDNWKMSLEQEFRWGDDAANLYYRHTDLGWSYSGAVDWLTLGINYRHVNEEKSGEWKYENRPHFNAEAKFKLLGLDFSNRGRFEYRNQEDSDNFWRYRNKFGFKLPWEMTKWAIQPYMADEIFYDFDIGQMNGNRLYTGFALKPLNNLSAEIYYLWETKEGASKWTDKHVLGTKLKLSF